VIPLAHAGGVDEIAFMLLPAVIFFLVLQLRRRHLEAEDKAGEDRPEEPPGR
jgi:hypothetical protein